MAQRWFTPSSARRALAEIRPVAERMSGLFRKLETLCPGRIDCDQPVNGTYFLLVRCLHVAISQLEGRGVRVEDPKKGLVGFPARRAGRTVLLCWQVGEPTLAYWREPEAGHHGRRLVDEDGPWEEAGSPGPVRGGTL